jgi:hypothetical protein
MNHFRIAKIYMYIPMIIELIGPFPSTFVADTDTMTLPLKGKHESGSEETQTSEQDAGEMILEAHISPVTELLKVTV